MIKTARKLTRGGAKPRQSDLKRAVSTAYYAVFHALCRNCADMLIGATKERRSEPAWSQVYRAVDHGHTKARCSDTRMIAKFPKDIEDFAATFVETYESRLRADYDPASRFLLSEVQAKIDKAEEAIGAFNALSTKDRRAFAALVVLKGKRN